MYEEDDYLHGGAGGGMGGGDDEHEENEEIPNEIWQEACWIVISAYFEEKGQQKGVRSCSMQRDYMETLHKGIDCEIYSWPELMDALHISYVPLAGFG